MDARPHATDLAPVVPRSSTRQIVDLRRMLGPARKAPVMVFSRVAPSSPTCDRVARMPVKPASLEGRSGVTAWGRRSTQADYTRGPNVEPAPAGLGPSPSAARAGPSTPQVIRRFSPPRDHSTGTCVAAARAPARRGIAGANGPASRSQPAAPPPCTRRQATEQAQATFQTVESGVAGAALHRHRAAGADRVGREQDIEEAAGPGRQAMPDGADAEGLVSFHTGGDHVEESAATLPAVDGDRGLAGRAVGF
jgi:hypothetical protein